MKLSLKLVTTIACLALAILAPPALAEPENPIIRGSMSVEVIGGGKVTGTGIDCGTECSNSTAWRENEIPPKNRLTATANPGWSFQSWTGCTPVAGTTPRCDAIYHVDFDGEPVQARFVDVQAPTVAIIGHTARPGATLALNLNVVDNDRVDRVEVLLDGQSIATRRTGYGNISVDVSGVAEGNYSLAARAFDASGNVNTSAASAVVVDHTGPVINLDSPAAATNAPRPSFSFSSGSDDFASAQCGIQKRGEAIAFQACNRGEWFAADAPTEGVWVFTVRAIDGSGNVSEVEHEFVVDRSAPVAVFTSGPTDGSVVQVGNVKYVWEVTDGLPVTQHCAWDNGESTACAGSASRGLTAGPHSFKVVFRDAAGNESTLARTLTVRKDGTTPPPDRDEIAPRISLKAPKQTLKSLGKALKLNISCNEACAGRIVVKAKGGLVFTAKVSLVKAGTAKLKLKPTAKVRRKIRTIANRNRKLTKPRPVAFTASAGLKDKAGNAGKATLKFKVKR